MMRRDVPRDGIFRKDVDHIALHRCFRDLVTCLDLAPVVQVSRAVGIYEDPEPGVGLVLQGEHLSFEVLEEVIDPESSATIGPGYLLYPPHAVLHGNRVA